jgi:predicted transcriptional regulator
MKPTNRILAIDLAKEIDIFLKANDIQPSDLNARAKLKSPSHVAKILQSSDPLARISKRVESDIRTAMVNHDAASPAIKPELPRMTSREFAAELSAFTRKYPVKPVDFSLAAGLSHDCFSQILRRSDESGVNAATVVKLRRAMRDHKASNLPIDPQPKAPLPPQVVEHKVVSRKPDMLRDALAMLTKEQLTDLLIKSAN